MALPPIDVLMPVHDALATLPEAVDDMLAQRDVSLRLIAVVDTHGTGRDDGSGAWLTARASQDERLIVLPSAGSGLTATLQTALDAAGAPLVSHMESDDRCPPDRLRQLGAALVGSEAESSSLLQGVTSQVQLFGAKSEGMQRYVAWQNGLLSHAEMSRERFIEIPALHQSGLYRREALLQVGGYVTRGDWPADIDFWFRWFEHDLAVAKLPEELYRWRQHPRQSTRASPQHDPQRLHAARVDALARRYGRHGSCPRRLRLVSTGATLAGWKESLSGGPFDLRGCERWTPGSPAPARPDGDELILAVYGMPRARDALRRALSGLHEPDELLFAG
jgi:hypothetical protein